ncbi:hypothetical protein SKAU_G00368680 [Synaphobranchus kaupii]|uniref:Cadherin cytoplasmic C-terminal domain-containing protein n=1 Tax=Synaphobranchus kaupii TaxID=118154 RepID=A0A9Q1EFN2_SYNKA|nr:hypothetical protein SKAU_G00368680 [Synaphobranchus kaupii]
MTYEENSSRLTSYLIIALVSVSTFFLTFIILIISVRFCRRRKPRLLFDGAVAIPSAYFPPNYAEVDGTGTLRTSYNYDAYLTAGSRTSDFKFVSSPNDATLPADLTLKRSQNQTLKGESTLHRPDVNELCRRRKPRLLFDGAVAIPSAYFPPNYTEVEGAGTLRSSYNYDTYLTTGSRTSDFKFVQSFNDGTLPADLTLKRSPQETSEQGEPTQDGSKFSTLAVETSSFGAESVLVMVKVCGKGFTNYIDGTFWLFGEAIPAIYKDSEYRNED